MFAIDRSEYKPLSSNNLEGQSACRREMKVYGRNLTVVIVYNPNLEKGQMQRILFYRERTVTKLFDLQKKLLRRVSRSSLQANEKHKALDRAPHISLD